MLSITNLQRVVKLLAILGCMAFAALMMLRGVSVFSWTEAMQMQTSGDEVSSLYAVWRVIEGLSVYFSRFEPPFSAALYNWLFYQAYGAVIGTGLLVLGLAPEWIPTLGRLFTLAGTLCVLLIGFFIFQGAQRHRGQAPITWLSASFAALIAFGPLVGFWAMTVRADVWALVFEMAAAAWFLKFYPRRKIAAILGLVILAYAAWAFKQSSILAVGAGGLFLLMRRDWLLALLFTSLMVLAWGVTLGLGGADYRNVVFLGDIPLSFELSSLFGNLGNFAVKVLPLLMPAAWVSWELIRRRGNGWLGGAWDNNALVLALCGILIAGGLTVPATSQTGAAENYFFTLSFFLALFLVSVAALCHRSWGFWGAIGLGWSGTTLATLAVLSGFVGVTDLRIDHRMYRSSAKCLTSLAGPIYVHNRYLSLPWMVPQAGEFVRSYVYEVDRAQDRKFEEGGIGGMIRAGHFTAIAIIGDEPPATLDGSKLDGYALLPVTCKGVSVLLRRD